MTNEWRNTVRVRCHSQCLKVTEKVSFNIASEASFVFISLKMGNFGDFLKNSVTRHVTFDWTTIDGKCQKKIECDFLGDFQTL